MTSNNEPLVKRKKKGYRVEQKLVKLLSKKPGNYVFRIPVSGSRANMKLKIAFPDVFLVNNAEDRIVAFEVKSTSGNYVKVPKEQISKLFMFLNVFKKYNKREAVIAVWFFKEKKWVFRKIDDGLINSDYVIRITDDSNWFP